MQWKSFSMSFVFIFLNINHTRLIICCHCSGRLQFALVKLKYIWIAIHLPNHGSLNENVNWFMIGWKIVRVFSDSADKFWRYVLYLGMGLSPRKPIAWDISERCKHWLQKTTKTNPASNRTTHAHLAETIVHWNSNSKFPIPKHLTQQSVLGINTNNATNCQVNINHNHNTNRIYCCCVCRLVSPQTLRSFPSFFPLRNHINIVKSGGRRRPSKTEPVPANHQINHPNPPSGPHFWSSGRCPSVSIAIPTPILKAHPTPNPLSPIRAFLFISRLFILLQRV